MLPQRHILMRRHWEVLAQRVDLRECILYRKHNRDPFGWADVVYGSLREFDDIDVADNDVGEARLEDAAALNETNPWHRFRIEDVHQRDRAGCSEIGSRNYFATKQGI